MGIGRFTALHYDARTSELEIVGGTTLADAEQKPIAIHVAVIQGNEALATGAVGHSVPSTRTGDRAWETRIHNARFRCEEALVLGLMIMFRAPDETERGGFETFTWAQNLTIEPAELKPDPLTIDPVEPPDPV